MDRLWAPWRIQYILSSDEKPEECILCAFPARGRGAYRAHGILCSTGSAFVMMNKYPYANGHVMVVPARHAADPGALPADDWQGTCELLRRTMAAIRAATNAAGLNVGLNLGRAAGAGIDAHLHWHVVPRWIGDHNFMPVVADTKVVSDALDASYERLLPHFAALGEGPA